MSKTETWKPFTDEQVELLRAGLNGEGYPKCRDIHSPEAECLRGLIARLDTMKAPTIPNPEQALAAAREAIEAMIEANPVYDRPLGVDGSVARRMQDWQKEAQAKARAALALLTPTAAPAQARADSPQDTGREGEG